MKKFISILSMLLCAIALFAGVETDPDSIVGIWKNETGKGHIQIFKADGKYHGRILWLKESKDAQGNIKCDIKNPDFKERCKPLIGKIMLRNLKFDGTDWTGGHIYNPGDGKEYKCYVKMKDQNTLNVRGYIGFSILGKSDTWSRVH